VLSDKDVWIMKHGWSAGGVGDGAVLDIAVLKQEDHQLDNIFPILDFQNYLMMDPTMLVFDQDQYQLQPQLIVSQNPIQKNWCWESSWSSTIV